MVAALLEMLDRLIGLEEKFLPKFAEGTSRHSLLRKPNPGAGGGGMSGNPGQRL